MALLSYAPLVASQPDSPFADCSASTGRSASLLIPLDATLTVSHDAAPTADLAEGSVLGVFTPEGVCAGTLTWDGTATALALWEDDPMTPKKDGFAEGDTLSYRLQDVATHGELAATSVRYGAPSSQSGLFVSDGVYFLSELAFSSPQRGDPPAFAFTFEPNYPNPFASRTTFRYAVSTPTRVRLELYDLLGRRVATVVDAHVGAGWHEVRFEPYGLKSGTYIARLSAGSQTATQRVTLVR